MPDLDPVHYDRPTPGTQSLRHGHFCHRYFGVCVGGGGVEINDILKHLYFESFSHIYYCMTRVYKIKLPEALICSQYFFAMFKVVTCERYS